MISRRASDRKVESGFRIVPMLNQSAGSSFVRPDGRTAIQSRSIVDMTHF
jgi:hypothetical protein